jgi:hypothetical protein
MGLSHVARSPYTRGLSEGSHGSSKIITKIIKIKILYPSIGRTSMQQLGTIHIEN